jgi:ribosome modulation factor
VLPEAYEQGREAGLDNLGEHRNPYRPVNSKKFQQWLEGYRDARRELGPEGDLDAPPRPGPGDNQG